MVPLLADENFDGRILRGLLRRSPSLDVVRVQDTHLYGASDPEVVTWAASAERVILTHDIATLVGHAYDLVEVGEFMAGVLAVQHRAAIGTVLDDLEILLLATEEGELWNRVIFVLL